VLNHSTRREFTKRWHCIDRVAIPRVGLATFWAIVSAFTLIGIIPIVVWGVSARLQLRRFINKGTKPLWTSTAAAATALAGVAS
jgi:hypothetical protein